MHFGEHKNHPAVQRAGALLKRGFAFDAPIGWILHFTAPPELKPRAAPVPELLRGLPAATLDEFAAELRDFYAKSGFAIFLESKESLHAGMIRRVAEESRLADVGLLRREEMRRLDERAIRELGIPGTTLMEHAGRGAATEILAWLASGRRSARGRRVAIVCGKGGNGGDGFVAARWLKRRGARPSVWLTAPAAEIGGDAARKLAELVRAGIRPRLVDDEAAVAADLAAAGSAPPQPAAVHFALADDPEGAPYTEFDFGRRSSVGFNGMDRDATRRGREGETSK